MLLLIVNLTIIYIVNLQTNRFERPLYEKGNEHNVAPQKSEIKTGSDTQVSFINRAWYMQDPTEKLFIIYSYSPLNLL